MKILMVSEFFPPVMGGMERHVAVLCKALAQRGHEVRVLTLGWKGLEPYEKIDDFEVYRLSGFFQKLKFLHREENKRYHPPLADPFLTIKLKQHIKTFKPDIIHCHASILYSLLSIKHYFKIPLVETLHEYRLLCPHSGMIKDFSICSYPLTSKCISCSQENFGLPKAWIICQALRYNSLKLKMVDKFIAVSNAVKEIYQQNLHLPDGKIEVIYNFYDSNQDFYDLNQQINDNRNNPFLNNFILFVGTLVASKGVDILLNAYQRLNKDIKLVIIGIKKPGYHYQPSKNVIILENQPHHVVMEAWRRCRFGVVPSVWPEPFGIVALEAMACGKAVVASDIGGLKDIVVHGKTGLLVPPRDVDALAEAMKKLIDNPNLAKEMGEKGQKRLNEHFTVEKIIEKIENLYQQLCKYA